MATNPSLLGRLLGGRYRLQHRRGAGAHGIVLDAFDEQLDRLVAVKIMMPQFVVDTAAESRFRFEAQAAASLTHPNLNAVYDWGVEAIEGAKVPYLVLEHLPGGSLRDMLDRGRLLSPSQALVVGLDVCRGLDYMHRRGVGHFDLKPANLAFGDDRHVRILDVGFSRLVAEQTWADPSAAGIDAARYASPEQAGGATPRDGDLTDATDVYSLTLILIEAVTGSVPFASDSTVATLNARVDKLMPVSADFGPLASVLSRAGSAVPADRYSAVDFGRALMQAAEKMPRPAPLPIVGPSIFGDPSGELRRPTDPTGPTTRPQFDDDVGLVAAGAVGTALLEVGSPPQAEIGSGSPQLSHSGFDAARSTSSVTAPPPPPPPPSSTSPGPLAEVDGAAQVGNQSSAEGIPRPALYDEAEIDPPKRHPWRWVIGALAVLVVLAGGVVVTARLLAPKSHVVPELAGMTEAIGRNQVAGNDWTVVVQRERNDEQPQDSIIRTDPVAGVELKEGSPIIFVVSDGLTLATLPNVTGQTLTEATATLANNNLDLIIGEEVFDEVVPAGTVMSWMVPAQAGLTEGMDVMQRTVVSVVVSKGPAPRQVPLLVGLDPVAAQAAVEALQLVFTRDVDRFSPDIAAGIVMDQSLPPGTEIDRGDTVVVAVSIGPDLVPMPSLEGQNFEQIQATLAASGLQVGDVTGPTDGSGFLVSVTVDGRDVQVGELLLRGTALDFKYF